MADTATEPAAQPSSAAHGNLQPWNTAIHEMAMNALIHKHSSSAVSPAATPTSKTMKSLCIPAGLAGCSSPNTVLQQSYITVNPSATGAGSLPLITAQGMHGGAQMIQGTPITMSMTQLSELGGASVVQLAPIGYTSTQATETALLQAQQ